MAAVALLMTQLALVMNHERNIAHLRASHRQLRHLVDVDALTKLPNRRHFHELAERAIKPAPGAATVLVFDIERLAHINEVLGHAIGDEALRQVGTVLRETLRRRDVAGRLGGDEFAVVLPRTRVADAGAAIARINARLDDRQVAPRIARVRLQVGAAQIQADETIADALRRAELALAATRSGAAAAESAERTQPLTAGSFRRSGAVPGSPRSARSPSARSRSVRFRHLRAAGAPRSARQLQDRPAGALGLVPQARIGIDGDRPADRRAAVAGR